MDVANAVLLKRARKAMVSLNMRRYLQPAADANFTPVTPISVA